MESSLQWFSVILSITKRLDFLCFFQKFRFLRENLHLGFQESVLQ